MGSQVNILCKSMDYKILPMTESYKEARTEIATLKSRLATAQATAAEATKQELRSHQGQAAPTTRRAPKRERCKCRGEVENCHYCYGLGWVGGGYHKN